MDSKRNRKISAEYTTKETETVIKMLSKKKVQERQFLWWILPNTWRINTNLSQTFPKKLSIMNIDAEILNNTLAYQVQQPIKRMIHNDKAELILGMEGILKNQCNIPC